VDTSVKGSVSPVLAVYY